MKTFIVCNNLGGGGAERVGINLAKGFAEHGYTTYIVTDIYQKANYPVREQVKVLSLCPQNKGKLRRWAGAIANLRRYVKQEQPDVIIGIMHLCSIIARIATVGTKVPVVMTIHHALESDTIHFSKIERFLDRYSHCLYEGSTILTLPDKECLGNRKNLFVMPNPLTFKTVEKIPQKEKILLAAGRLSDWNVKGFDVLIKAWSLVTEHGENEKIKKEGWRLMVAGDGSDEAKAYLRQLIRVHHVEDSMELLGYRTDMEQLFQKASIFVLSSRSEGLPMVLIEAMSQGCAPVATDFKGRTREIIPTDNEGILCNPEDAEALAAGMQRLIEDDALRQNIQRNAVERSKFYALDNIVGMWEKVLSQCTMHNA